MDKLSPYFTGIDYDKGSADGEVSQKSRTSNSRIGNSEVRGAGCVPTNLPNPYGKSPEYQQTKGKPSRSSESYDE